jgi:DNA-directed RNA polymerase subunit beta
MLAMFFETDTFHLGETPGAGSGAGAPARRDGQLRYQGRRRGAGGGRPRVTARHIRELQKAGIERLAVPDEFLIGRTLAHDQVDTETGEVIAEANAEITEELLALLREKGVERLETLFVNDLDHGPYLSETLRIDTPRPSSRRRSRSIA